MSLSIECSGAGKCVGSMRDVSLRFFMLPW